MFSPEKLTQIEALESSASHTVTIVDDKSANLSVMAAILRPYYRVLEANDGQEALTMLSNLEDRDSVACIISDHRMPRMTGVELFEQLQPLLPGAVRVIVTGYIDVDAVVDAINKAEVFKFIVKPFDAKEFLATVKLAVDKYDEQQEQSKRHAGLLAENRALLARIAALEARA
jgi:DNA-binding NtrC family response regulator